METVSTDRGALDILLPWGEYEGGCLVAAYMFEMSPSDSPPRSALLNRNKINRKNQILCP
jgi:hypothetical protein